MTAIQFLQAWGAEHTCEQAVDALDFGEKNAEVTAALIDVGLDKSLSDVWGNLSSSTRSALLEAYNNYRIERAVGFLVGSESFRKLLDCVLGLNVGQHELPKVFNGALRKVHFSLKEQS
jgi:hypothetical protein